METVKKRTRDISFYSEKNGAMVMVHTQFARDYAKFLETRDDIASYEAGYPLETERFVHVSPVGIRPSYFQSKWVSDFMICCADGSCGIRELVTEAQLSKRAVVEKLELSRRYWAGRDIADWKIVVMGEKGEKEQP